MVVLKGNQVSLDDLLGYSKLQDLLSTIIGSVNDQDETVAKVLNELQVEAARNTQKLNEQDLLLEQMRSQVESAVGRIDQAVSAQERALEERVSPLEQRMQQLEAQQQGMAKLEAGLKAVEQRQEPVEARVSKLESTQKSSHEQIADIEVKLSGLAGTVDDLQRQLTKATGSLTETVTGMQASLSKHEEQLAQLTESLETLRKGLDAVQTECTMGLAAGVEKDTQLGEKITTVESEVTVGLEELTRKEAADAEAIKRLEDALRKVAQESGLRGLIDELKKKLAAQAEQLAGLTGQMAAFDDKGSSGTARCLSCYSKRAQNPNKIVVGSDGKTYFQTSGGQVNLGRLGGQGMSNTNVPGRNRSPNGGGRQRTTSPQMSRNGGSTSLPSL